MRNLKTDVLIVGAGPAGLACALGLANQGIDFLIVDALEEAQDTSRAAVIHAATLGVLNELGVASSLINQGIEVEHFRARDRDDVLFHADFSMLAVPHPFALMIPQDESERIMIERLRETGCNVMRSTRLVALDCEEDGAIATCASNSGALTIRARLVVGADGERSTVRATRGIRYPGQTYGSFMLADVRMDWPTSRNEVSLFFSQAGTLVVAPMSEGRYRVVAQHQDAPASVTVFDVQKVLDARGPSSGATVLSVLWGSRFKVNHKLAEHFRDGPVVLVGDAAHVHSPAGGQGMNLGLRDAHHLSKAVGCWFRDGNERWLDDYANERHRAARSVLRMTDRLTRLATLPGARRRFARNRVLARLGNMPSVRRKVACKLAGFIE